MALVVALAVRMARSDRTEPVVSVPSSSVLVPDKPPPPFDRDDCASVSRERFFSSDVRYCVRVVAVDVATGTRHWTSKVLGLGSDLVSVAGGTVLVDVGEGDEDVPGQRVVALDSRTGRIRWKDYHLGPVNVAGDVALIWWTGDETRAVDVRSGQTRWRHKGYAIYADNSVAIFDASTEQTPTIVGVDPATGRDRWTLTAKPDAIRATIDGKPALRDGKVVRPLDLREGVVGDEAFIYEPSPTDWLTGTDVTRGVVIASRDRVVVAVDGRTGRELWRRGGSRVSGEGGAVVIARRAEARTGSKASAGLGPFELESVDIASGATLWRREVAGVPLDLAGRVLVRAEDGDVILDAASGNEVARLRKSEHLVGGDATIAWAAGPRSLRRVDIGTSPRWSLNLPGAPLTVEHDGRTAFILADVRPQDAKADPSGA